MLKYLTRHSALRGPLNRTLGTNATVPSPTAVRLELKSTMPHAELRAHLTSTYGPVTSLFLNIPHLPNRAVVTFADPAAAAKLSAAAPNAMFTHTAAVHERAPTSVVFVSGVPVQFGATPAMLAEFLRARCGPVTVHMPSYKSWPKNIAFARFGRMEDAVKAVAMARSIETPFVLLGKQLVLSFANEEDEHRDKDRKNPLLTASA